MKHKNSGFIQHHSYSLINRLERVDLKIFKNDAGFTQHHFRSSTSDAGFTLIELLVVISVIAILSSISAVNLFSARARARDAIRSQNMDTMVKALQAYYQDYDEWPHGDTGIYTSIPAVSKCFREIDYNICLSYEPCSSVRTDGTPNDSNWIDDLGSYFAYGYPPKDPTLKKCPKPGQLALLQSDYYYGYAWYKPSNPRSGEFDIFYIPEDPTNDNLPGKYYQFCPTDRINSYCMVISGKVNGSIED